MEDYKQEPCDDAISREAVREILTKYHLGESRMAEELNELPPVTQKSETVTEFADRCRECGKRYVKRQTGHWIWNVEKGYCKCSECGIGMGHTEYDFCPNCGARMESGDKE